MHPAPLTVHVDGQALTVEDAGPQSGFPVLVHSPSGSRQSPGTGRTRASDDAFRARLRAFFAAHHPGRPPKDPTERLAWTRAWLAVLFDNGAGAGRVPRLARWW